MRIGSAPDIYVQMTGVAHGMAARKAHAWIAVETQALFKVWFDENAAHAGIRE